MEIFQNGYALIIGVGNDLPATVNDANRIYNIFIDKHKAGYPKIQVELLTENAQNKATKANILTALDNIAQKATSDSTVIVYYSGHGDTYNDDFVFIPSDFIKHDYSTSLTRNDLSKALNKINAKKKMFIFDSCHAEGMTKGERNKRQDNILDVGQGVVFIASCLADELSRINPTTQYSIFTECLVEALEGANSKNLAFVNYLHIMEYLENQVPQRVYKIHSTKQTPVLNAHITKFNVCFNNHFKPPSPKILIINDPKDNLYLVKLNDYLQVLKDQKLIASWSFNDIPPFANILENYKQKLQDSDFAIGIITKNFLNSDNCKVLLAEIQQKKYKFIAILAENCGYKYFPNLKDLKILPINNGESIPVNSKNWQNEEDAYMQIVDEIFEFTQTEKII